MTFLFGLLFAMSATAAVYLAIMWILERRRAGKASHEFDQSRAKFESRERALEHSIVKFEAQIARLSKWTVVADADDKAKEILAGARAVLEQAQRDARILVTNAEEQYRLKIEAAHLEAMNATAEGRAKAKEMTEKAHAAIAAANARGAQIIADANAKAEQIAGKAYDAVRNAEMYERRAKAMRNIIEGYGDEYLKPTEGLLDDIADEFSHKEAGQQLKLARDRTKAMIKQGLAATCEYVEDYRRRQAIQFVLDAFNGKVDAILSDVKHDNHGKLEQRVRDAYEIVNMGGQAFRNARITDPYLATRLDELKWACVALELRRQEQEQQRRIREQIREEEKARREYERAIREAAREEEMLRKAMAKAQAQVLDATAEQRAQYEAQLAELTARLQEAEERGQRALSMAQQTRRGHVYIISNVGSFGDGVYKIGLTRRLEPLDRVKELGDASVPFEFDVHAIILSDDAPALETKLHKHFLLNQINKVNHRKEFFRANLSDIRREIEAMGIEAHWTMAAEALQYRETLAIERAIESDPNARDAWLNRQLTLDPVEYVELAAVDDE
ncbi:MAG: DUF4041 domain-containing protein [Phycisphaerales bacterium]